MMNNLKILYILTIHKSVSHALPIFINIYANLYRFIQSLRKKMKLASLYCLFVIHCCCAQTAYLFTPRGDNDKPGFFGAFNSVLAALDFCEQHNAILGVDFQKVGWYYDPQKGSNWWDYYFDQPRLPLKTPVQEVKRFKGWQKSLILLEGLFVISKVRAHELIKRYIRIKEPIQKIIDTFYAEHMQGYYMIGIHYRGTDKIDEAPRVAYEHVLDVVQKEIDSQENKPYKIFIATDEQAFLGYMQNIYGSLICSIDALRSTDDHPVHMNETLNNYKKGQDALIDCILLSKCDLLIRTASYLSESSQMFNPHMPVVHLNRRYNE